MKNKFRGIKFNVWLYFFLFTFGILFILGILQFSLIRPYYRDNKIVSIEKIADKIQYSIIDSDKTDEKDVKDAFQVAVNNNVCILVFNSSGNIVYQADGLGASCLFSQTISVDGVLLVPNKSGMRLNEVMEVSNGVLSKVIVNEKSDQEMVLYGRKVEVNLGNFYLYINGPLEPIDSLITFLQDQYLMYSGFILLMSVLISLFISSNLSKPIVKMKTSADKLASAEYNEAIFKGSYFMEIDDLARTLNLATTQLSKVDELRKDLIANMSHDIKTPLTMIKAYAEMIRDISGDNIIKREEHLSVIIKEVDYLDNLVNDMQELSRMQSGNYQLNKCNFDIVEKVNDVIILFKVLLEKNNITILIDSLDSIIAYGDPIKMGQVIYNFISNAIKHSESDNKIKITITKKDEIVRFEIKDEAGGIPDDKIAYIWDRYYKIDKTFKRSSMGTGLGLAIVKAVLDNHGAKYGVKSVYGKGSTFWFELFLDDDQLDIM
ncbi:MAG: sensor histidine kinase [Anaerorhabdus sp.]